MNNGINICNREMKLGWLLPKYKQVAQTILKQNALWVP